MGIIEWLINKFGRPVLINAEEMTKEITEEYSELIGDIYIREIAFWSAVNIMANALSKCEFKTYRAYKKVKGPEYYLWNVEPNKNQNSSAFLHKLIAKLYRENECLIIEYNSQLLIADSFTRTPSALGEDIFLQVSVEDYAFPQPFRQSDVLYFRLAESDIRKLVNGLYESYSKLIAYSIDSYKRSKGIKGIFKYESLPVTGSKEEEAFNALLNVKIKKWLSTDSAALPLGKGQDWKDYTNRTYEATTTRDIRAMMDDVSDFTAKAFGIPPALMRGDVSDTSKIIDQLLTFAADPLVDMIQEEIIRKRYGYAEYSRGNYLSIDTKSIKHIDLLSVATAIDKLIGSGSFCIDDIREALGDEPINEPWSQQHFITKNYELVEEALKALKGGETG